MTYSPVNAYTFPVNPNFPWLPAIQQIASITQGNPTVVTTTQDHGYSTGFIVKIFYPSPYFNEFGMPQIADQSAPIIVLSSTSFSIAINSLAYNAFKSGYSSITSISLGYPTIVTCTASNFIVGQIVTVTQISGTTELNGGTYAVSAVGSTTITLNFNSTGFTPYVGGGVLQTAQTAQAIPTGQVTNLDLFDSVQVNPPNPQTLAGTPLFQQPGLQAAGPASTSQT